MASWRFPKKRYEWKKPTGYSRRVSDETERLEARLVELEVRYMHQAAELRDLSDVVYAQGQEIQRLRARVDGLEKKLGQVDEVDRPTDPSDEVPPHY